MSLTRGKCHESRLNFQYRLYTSLIYFAIFFRIFFYVRRLWGGSSRLSHKSPILYLNSTYHYARFTFCYLWRLIENCATENAAVEVLEEVFTRFYESLETACRRDLQWYRTISTNILVSKNLRYWLQTYQRYLCSHILNIYPSKMSGAKPAAPGTSNLKLVS